MPASGYSTYHATVDVSLIQSIQDFSLCGADHDGGWALSVGSQNARLPGQKVRQYDANINRNGYESLVIVKRNPASQVKN